VSNKPLKESLLRNALRDVNRFPEGRIGFIEPANGSDVGLPDCLVAIGDRWKPLELKRGNSVIKELRPTQRLWHRTSLSFGIRTHGLVLRSDYSVILFEIKLSGGFSSELSEAIVCEFELDFIDYAVLSLAMD